MIETERLMLRHIALTDAEDIFEYAKDEDTGPRAGWTPHKNIEETKGLIEMWISPESKEETFAIFHKGDNKVIGTVGITIKKEIKDNRGVVINQLILDGKKAYEIGITVSKKYWGKGIATEALKEMIDYLFKNRNADVVITCHFAENIASKKIQEKNNMKVIDEYQRNEKWYNTNCTTLIVRGKTRKEWIEEIKSL